MKLRSSTVDPSEGRRTSPRPATFVAVRVVALTAALPAALAVVPGTALAAAADSPPTTPANPVARVYGATAGAVLWERSSDDRLVVGYEVSRDGRRLGIFDALSRVERGLEPGRTYRYAIVAVDTVGQRSGTARVSLTTPDATPVAPTGLRADVYSRTTAELFWDRSGVFGERYLIKRDGREVTITDGTSHIDRTLATTRPYLFEVIALNRQGKRSTPTRLFVDTARDGAAVPDSPTGPALAAPGGLRASVYSRTAAELFWLRPETFGLRYEVRRDGVLVTTTDGVGFFDDTLESGRRYVYDVTAIAPDGRRSGASTIALETRGGDGGGASDDVLNADNAEAILREVVSIANGEFLPPLVPIAGEEAGELLSIFIGTLSDDGAPTSTAGYALIEGSLDEPREGGSSGDGGRYTCAGGGTAALVAAFAGEDERGYEVRFDRCVTLSTTLGATVTLDGATREIPRAGRNRGRFSSYENFSVEGEGFRLAIDGEDSDILATPSSDRFVGNARRTLTTYTRTTPDGVTTTIDDYRGVSLTEITPSIEERRYRRRASADVVFGLATNVTDGRMLDVTIDLVVDESSDSLALPEPPIGQWLGGAIDVRAADGSRIRAEPLTEDPTSLRIVVGDTAFERAWADGYQVECYGTRLGCN